MAECLHRSADKNVTEQFGNETYFKFSFSYTTTPLGFQLWVGGQRSCRWVRVSSAPRRAVKTSQTEKRRCTVRVLDLWPRPRLCPAAPPLSSAPPSAAAADLEPPAAARSAPDTDGPAGTSGPRRCLRPGASLGVVQGQTEDNKQTILILTFLI